MDASLRDYSSAQLRKAHLAQPIPEPALEAIEAAVAVQPDGASLAQIADVLTEPGARRTLQYCLRFLVSNGRLQLDGTGRAARYRLPADASTAEVAEDDFVDIIPLSEGGRDVRHYLRQPGEMRQPVGYDQDFLDRYQPNATFFLGGCATSSSASSVLRYTRSKSRD